MNRLLQVIARPFRSTQPVPDEHRANFNHLYLDVAWYGVLSGSTLSFLVIYATRLGASGAQIGLVNAIPAVVTLIFAMPVSAWLSRRPIKGAVFWSALIFRLFYLLLIPLPWLFGSAAQIWAIIAITLVMNVPGTGLAVGFQALFAEAVPDEWRGHVAGIRNAVLALTSTITALVSGYILTHTEFSTGYQIVFAIGFIGALLSTIHIGLVRMREARPAPSPEPRPVAVPAPRRRPFRIPIVAPQNFRLDIIRGPFWVTFVLLFAFHLGQYLAIPVFPLFTVNYLQFSDQILSLGSALFNIATFVASLRLSRLSYRLGNRRVLGYGVVMLGFYPLLIALTRGAGLYAVASLVGGVAWALAGGVLYNYLLEKVPAGDRPAYLAWYTLALNAAILLGSLLGPVIAGQIGLITALIVYAVLRSLAGLAILRWG